MNERISGKTRDADAVRLNAAMDRYADGDDGAFGELYSGLSRRLRAFLRRLGCSPELAEDLLQETFARLHRARGNFARGSAVVPWAYAIARNVYIDAHRARRARPREVTDQERGSDPGDLRSITERTASSEASGEQHAIARQTAAAVEAALASMTLARREAFVLLRYEGRSLKEAAAILGTTEGAVKLRAFHAYEELRLALEREPQR